MDEKLLIAVISASSAIIGGAIGGLISTWNTKVSADREDRRRQLEIERVNAVDRLEKLYKPLLRVITPSPPYDDFHIDTETQKRAIVIIEKNEMYASPDLMNFFWTLRHVYYEKRGDIDRGFEWEFYSIVSEELARLKDILGYGRILRKPSISKIILDKTISYTKNKWGDVSRLLFVKRVKKRRSKVKGKSRNQSEN